MMFSFSIAVPVGTGHIKVEDTWRQYYNSGAENPLSAAATAMINIHEEQATALMYESYAFKSHQIGQPNVASAALPELWR